MDVFFVLAGWLVMLFFVTHDAYLAWFEPKKYIETLRKRRFRTLKLFPFFKSFYLMWTKVLFYKATRSCCLS